MIISPQLIYKRERERETVFAVSGSDVTVLHTAHTSTTKFPFASVNSGFL